MKLLKSFFLGVSQRFAVAKFNEPYTSRLQKLVPIKLEMQSIKSQLKNWIQSSVLWYLMPMKHVLGPSWKYPFVADEGSLNCQRKEEKKHLEFFRKHETLLLPTRNFRLISKLNESSSVRFVWNWVPAFVNGNNWSLWVSLCNFFFLS